MRKFLFFSLISIILSSCMGPKSLQNKLNRTQYDLGYIHDSKLVSDVIDVIDVNVVPTTFDVSDSILNTKVTKVDGKNIWLVIMHHIEYDLLVELGKGSLNPQIDKFITNSFIKESERSAIYKVNDSISTNTYSLYIFLEDYNIKTEYYKEFTAAGGMQQLNISINPSEGYVKLKAELYNSDSEMVFTRNYFSKRRVNYPKTRFTSESKVNKSVMQNMTENISECLKESISALTQDLNNYFRAQNNN